MTLYQLCQQVRIPDTSYISYWNMADYCIKFKQLRDLTIEEANHFADYIVREIYTSVDDEIILGLIPPTKTPE